MEKSPVVKRYSFTSRNYAFGLSSKPGDIEMYFLDRPRLSNVGVKTPFKPGFRMSEEVGREIFERPEIKVYIEGGYIKDIKLLKSK